MTAWHRGRLLAWDVESTGVDVFNDRIVSAHVEILEDGQPVRGKSWLIDPGIPIPAGATAIHGITDEMAAEGMAPVDALGQIGESLGWAMHNGVPIVGWNVTFDLTMFAAELDRHQFGIRFQPHPVMCGLVIDKWQDAYRKGSRRLVDVAPHYGVTLHAADAHGAKADAIAAGLTIYAMAERFEGLRTFTADELHDRLAVEAESQARSFERFKRKTDPSFVGETGWPIRKRTA